MANRKQLENLGVSLPPEPAFGVDVNWKDFRIIGLWLLSKIGLGGGSIPVPTQAGQVLRSGSVSPFTPTWSFLPVSEGGNGAEDAAKMLVFGSDGSVTAAAFNQAGAADNVLGGSLSVNSLTSQGAVTTSDRFQFQNGPSFGAPDEFTIYAYDSVGQPITLRVKAIEAPSPDGTIMLLSPPNGGGAATWVASA